MRQVRGPLLADLLRRLLEDPQTSVDVELVSAGPSDDQDRMRVAIDGSVELSRYELSNLRAAIGRMSVHEVSSES